MKFVVYILGVLFLGAAHAQFEPAYIGGNNPQSIYNNPSLVLKYLLKTQGKVQEACLQVPGVGYSILSISQCMQAVNNLLDSKNPDSFVKIIYIQVYVNPKNQQKIFKTVIMFKTFTSTTFLGIESLYKNGPNFELITYILDSDIRTIRNVMNDESIDPTEVFACGDLKEIFSKKVFRSA